MQEQLFSDELTPVPPPLEGREFPARILQLWAVYGIHGEACCKTCRHLFCHGHTRNYYKCRKSKITRGAGTDWRVSWPACGLYEERL